MENGEWWESTTSHLSTAKPFEPFCVRHCKSLDSFTPSVASTLALVLFLLSLFLFFFPKSGPTSSHSEYGRLFKRPLWSSEISPTCQ